MKSLALAGAMALALSAAGCAQFDALTADLSSPQTTQAAQNIGQFTRAFACGLSAASAAAQGVIGQSYDGKPLVDSRGQSIAAIVYASSQAACSLLGGVLTSASTVSVPVTAVAK